MQKHLYTNHTKYFCSVVCPHFFQNYHHEYFIGRQMISFKINIFEAGMEIMVKWIDLPVLEIITRLVAEVCMWIIAKSISQCQLTIVAKYSPKRDWKSSQINRQSIYEIHLFYTINIPNWHESLQNESSTPHWKSSHKWMPNVGCKSFQNPLAKFPGKSQNE